jgi:hypothetical protein
MSASPKCPGVPCEKFKRLRQRQRQARYEARLRAGESAAELSLTMTSKPAKVIAIEERRDRESRKRVDAVLAEFNGNVDAMAEEILYWRSRMRLIAEVVAKVQAEEPFAILGAGPVPHLTSWP